MVQLDKRKAIWKLHGCTPRIKSIFETEIGMCKPVSEEIFFKSLKDLGFDVNSVVLREIVQIAVSDARAEIDVALLLQVISQAVQKVLDKSALFWNTVISVSSGTISWVDFRRKLMKWLSSNGMTAIYIKSAMTYVESALDPGGLGVVRKESFLKFSKDIMGIDCLLSPDIFSNAKPFPVARKASSGAGETSPIAPIAPSQSVTELPVVPLHMSIAQASIPPSLMDSRSNTSRVDTSPVTQRDELRVIRLRLGVGTIDKLVIRTKRILFACYRSSKPLINEKVIFKASAAGDARGAAIANRSISSRLLGVCIRKHQLKLLSICWIQLIMLGHGMKTPTRDDVIQPENNLWNVTMQAMAVASLVGILRTANFRTMYPGFLSLRTGKPVDEIYAIRRVSYAQSKQALLDVAGGSINTSKVTGVATGGSVRQPLQENVGIPLQRNLEFDLSV